MAVKRKRSEAALDDGDASQRRLRSGRTVQPSASPKKKPQPRATTRPQTQRSPRKRTSASTRAVSNGEDVDDDGGELPLPPPAQTSKPVTTTYQKKVPKRKATAVVDEADLGGGFREDDSAKKGKGVTKDRMLTCKSTIELEGTPDSTSKQGRESATETLVERSSNTIITYADRQRKRGALVVEVPVPSPSKRTKRLPPVTQANDPSASYPTPAPSQDLHYPSTQVSVINQSTLDPGALPIHLHVCLAAQKRELLKSLRFPTGSVDEEQEPSANDLALKQLNALVEGTVMRAEGNSCLLLGPRGSGKSRILESCIAGVSSSKPIVLRLSGWVQSTDKHALREIAFQLLQQTGASLLQDIEGEATPADATLDENKDENPFLDRVDRTPETTGEQSMRLPPSGQLHALIPVLLTLNRPVIVILDAFDLFALHPRQSLLYCLLDTVQSCRASSENRGIAVIGITSRIDAIQLLEKRVKSRFSGRTIRTAPPHDLQHWLTVVKCVLAVPISCDNEPLANEWNKKWTSSLNKFLSDSEVQNVFSETFSITRDIKMVQRLLTNSILRLDPSEPYLSFKALSASIESQRARPRNMHLNNLTYPAMCLLIASIHAETAGHTTFTFEQLFDNFRDQVRASTSAPVQVNGGNIGMVRCTREVLMTAFDALTAAKMFVCTVGPSTNVAKEFIKHRSTLDRQIVKKIIEKSGQIYLKKWLHKG